MANFTRTVKEPDTFGLMGSTKATLRARSRGEVAARTGRHAGGPCPAVCLATLTGWSYQRAENHLRRHGFRGDGMFRHILLAAFREVLGEERGVRHTGGTVEATCRDLPPSFNGAVFCRGHVMPVRNGRLSNASAKHRRMRCEMLVSYSICEEVI